MTLRNSAILTLALACAVLAPAGCIKEVLSGEDPDVHRPAATGDNKRDQLVINVPWMEPPVPRILVEGQPILAERVSGLTPDHKMRYMIRTRTGALASLLITMDNPTPDTAVFVYEVTALPAGYTLDLPIGIGEVGRRGAIAIEVNGAPFIAPPSATVAVIPLSRDEKTRIRAIRIKKPTPAATPPGTSP